MPDSAAESQKHHLSKIRPHGLVKLLAFTSVYFSESGLFNGLGLDSNKKNSSPLLCQRRFAFKANILETRLNSHLILNSTGSWRRQGNVDCDSPRRGMVQP